MAKTEHATATIAPNATATEVADESFCKFDGAGAGAGAKTSAAAQNDLAAPEFKLQQVFAKSVNSVEAAVDKAEQVSGEPKYIFFFIFLNKYIYRVFIFYWVYRRSVGNV